MRNQQIDLIENWNNLSSFLGSDKYLILWVRQRLFTTIVTNFSMEKLYIIITSLSCFTVVPISSPGCEYQFGLFSDGSACSTNYVKCEHGSPYSLPCEPGLAYDDRIKKCNWPDELVDVGCNPAGAQNFRLSPKRILQ